MGDAGRTLNSDEDNITGWTTFEWMPGGFFIKAEGEFNLNGFVMQSLEIIGYDPAQKEIHVQCLFKYFGRSPTL